MSRGMVSIRGTNQLRSKLRELQDLRDVQAAVRTHGAETQQKAIRNAARDTGALKRRITLEVASNGLEAKVYPGMHYGLYLEYGTRFMSPQPFIRPAWREQLVAFQNDIDRIIQKKTR